MEQRIRSIAKTISFRILATITTIILVYFFTGSLEIAGAVGFLDIISKLILYYFHERAWINIKWGLEPKS